MKRLAWSGFLILLLFDTLAQVSFKFAALHAQPLGADAAWLWRVFGHGWIYGAIAGYLGAFFTWLSLLKSAPVGPAFAASHLEILSVMLASAWLFGEPLTQVNLAGAGLILAGVACLAKGEAALAGAGQAQSPSVKSSH